MMEIDPKSTVLSFQKNLFETVSIYPLISFRFLWGFLIAFGTYRFIVNGWVDSHYIEPVVHFTYPGFAWLKPMSAQLMYLVHYLIILFAISFALGLFYRFSAFCTFVLFSYTELIDLTYYLNHYYFISLVSLIMVFLPANKYLSLDVYWRKIKSVQQVPFYSIFILRFIIALVYIYAGIAKINVDWLLHAMPLKLWLPAKDGIPFLGTIFQLKWTPLLFSWFGMLFDTFIVFFLLVRTYRPYAFFVLIVFHLLTAVLFQIGMFPFVMIASVLIFFSGDEHYRFWRKLFPSYVSDNKKVDDSIYFSSLRKKIITAVLSVFIVFQLLFPWRYLLYKGDLLWNERGYRYSWRVMLMEKSGSAVFYLQTEENGKKLKIDNSDFLNAHQEKQMSTQPDLIYQYVAILSEYYKTQGYPSPIITSEIYITLNGRPSKLLFDKDIVLNELIEYDNFHSSMNISPR